jgi:hypothetical protein
MLYDRNISVPPSIAAERRDGKRVVLSARGAFVFQERGTTGTLSR